MPQGVVDKTRRKEVAVRPQAKAAASKPASVAAPTPPRSRWLVALAAGGALLAATITAFTLVSIEKDVPPPVSPPAEAAITSRIGVAAPGLVEAASGIRKLAFEEPGKIRAVRVDEGQTVKTGQVLAELESDEYAAQVATARATVNARQAELETLKADLRAELEKAQREVERLTAETAMIDAGPRTEEIQRAKAQVRVAQAEAQLASEDAKRYSNPQGVASGAWSEAQRDHAVHQAEAVAGKLELARAQLQELEAGARPEERQKAHAALASAQAECARITQSQASRLAAGEAQLAAATAQFSAAQVELEKTRLLSPLTGIVVWKFLHAGETVDALQRQPVVAVADQNQMQIRAYVDEADFPRVEPGQTAVVTADAYPGRSFRGRVLRVNTSAGEKPFNTGEVRERIDVKVIETIVVPAENWPFKLGLRVTVRFDVPVAPR